MCGRNSRWNASPWRSASSVADSGTAKEVPATSMRSMNDRSMGSLLTGKAQARGKLRPRSPVVLHLQRQLRGAKGIAADQGRGNEFAEEGFRLRRNEAGLLLDPEFIAETREMLGRGKPLFAGPGRRSALRPA